MNKILFIIVFITGIIVKAQVSTTRINEIKLGEKKSSLERLIKKSINLEEDENSIIKTGNIVYKNIVYELSFLPLKGNDDEFNNEFELFSIKSKNKSLQTLSGIRIGATLDELINTYKNYDIAIADYWEDYGVRSKTTRNFIVNDSDTNSFLEFTLINGVVKEMHVRYSIGYEDYF